MVDVKYRTSASASGGGREGHAKSADGKVDVQLSVPKELGGGGGAGTNPEQLFAAGYSACFLGAIRHVAGQEKIKLPDVTSVDVEVGIGPREDGTGFGLEVAIEVKVPGMDKAAAEALVEKADIVCPYSHATKGNIKRSVTVV